MIQKTLTLACLIGANTEVGATVIFKVKASLQRGATSSSRSLGRALADQDLNISECGQQDDLKVVQVSIGTQRRHSCKNGSHLCT